MFAFFLSACSKPAVINTGKMPGATFNAGATTNKKAGTVVKRAKSGIYIIKDEGTLNTTGYNFNIQAGEQQLGPGDVKFDYEDFKTRY